MVIPRAVKLILCGALAHICFGELSAPLGKGPYRPNCSSHRRLVSQRSALAEIAPPAPLVKPTGSLVGDGSTENPYIFYDDTALKAYIDDLKHRPGLSPVEACFVARTLCDGIDRIISIQDETTGFPGKGEV